MNKINALRLSITVSALAVASAAGAQTAAPVIPNESACQAPSDQTDKEACPDAAKKETATGKAVAQPNEDIVVVGSRIRRDEFNTPDNIQVITRKETTQAGFVSTSQVLQSTAVTGGTAQINDSYGGFVVNGGPGVNTVSLRGLGTTRTLVLLNGRRVAPAGSRGSVGSADLNVLPNAMIDRIEVLNTGASSIYGSDAVAGVVNIVTRTNVKGLTLEAQQNVPEAGAGREERYSLVGGWTGVDNRLKVIGSLEYYNRRVMRLGDRDFASCPTQYYGTDGTDFGAGNFVDPRTGKVRCFTLQNGGVTVNTIGTRNFNVTPDTTSIAFAPGVLSLAPSGTDLIQCNRFRPNSAITGTLVPGYECVGGAYFHYDTVKAKYVSNGGIDTNIRDTQSRDALNADLISPAKTYTGYGQISFDTDVLGDAQVYVNVLANRRDSHQDGTRQFSIDYPVNSPLIPAAIAGAGPLSSAIGIRAFTDFGLYDNRQRNDFLRLNGGMTGHLPLDWRYDLFLGQSWSHSKYTSDMILNDRLTNSLNVVADGSGGFICADATARANGCVAAPVMTPAIVGGQYQNTPWFDYIVHPVTGDTKYRESTVNLTLDGALPVSLPGGAVQSAIGVEYRKARINDTPALDSINNNLFGFTSSQPTRGSDSVWEGFGELELPVLKEQLIHSLTLNGSARYTHYKSYGGQWTYKIGGLLSPIKAVTFRGSYGTSYRAPALFEQFLGSTSGFLPNTTDPCNDLASKTNPLVIQRCEAEGLDPNFRQNSSVVVIGKGGAEAGLKAETSKALTYGVVVHPPLGSLGDFSVSADYFNVKVSNGVSRLSAAQVLSQCYQDPQRTLCDTPFIVRDPNTKILTVIQSYVNISDAAVSGIDFNARYSNRIGPGRLTLGAAMTRFSKRYNRTLPTDSILNVIGLISNPRWTGTFDANYEVAPFILHYGVEWVGKTNSQAYAEPFGYDPNKYYLKTPNYFLHNASVSFNKDGFGVTVGVRNLFDRNPPIISAEYTNQIGNAPLYSAYDYKGRTFFVNVSTALDRVARGLGL
jgi:outer membrane receptor protein involved in Fe transport